MNPPVLAIDVGNSRYKVGFLESTIDAGLPTCVESAAIPLAADLPWDVIAAWLRSAGEWRGIVAGSNPAGIRKVLGTWPANWPSPLLLDDPARFPIEVDVDAPGTVGIDRLLNAVAANVIRDSGRPVIVVDSGTATTVDAISADGVFRGGAILPGFELASRALHQYTALLPYVPVEELDEGSPVVGRNTRDALRSGLFHAQVGAVRELVTEMSQTLSPVANPHVLLTGGGAHPLAPRLPKAELVPHLTLQGLVLAAGD